MIRFLLGLAAALALLAPGRSHADYHINSPYEIDLGEIEMETNGDTTVDHRASLRGAQSHTIEVGTGLTAWWHSEVELGFSNDPSSGQATLLTQLVSENTFQLTEPGEAFLDLGFFVEYGQSLTRGRYAAANEVTFGPLIAKDIGPTTHTLNLYFTRQLGPDQTTPGLDFSYGWQSRWNLSEFLSPAVEVYGDAGVLGSAPRLSQQELLAGPVALGAVRLIRLGLGQGGQVKYELGWLFGATPATAQGTLRWRLELELPF